MTFSTNRGATALMVASTPILPTSFPEAVTASASEAISKGMAPP
jgi:hypothetical protein